MTTELLPCKKHGKLPRLVEVDTQPWHDSQMWPRTKRYEYQCDECQLEKKDAENLPRVRQWNEEQK